MKEGQFTPREKEILEALKRERNKRIHSWLLICGIILVFIGVFVVVAQILIGPPTPQNQVLPSGFDTRSIAENLTVAGFKVYTVNDCPKCEDQAKYFGEDMIYLNEITCDTVTDNEVRIICDSLYGFPAWQFPDGQFTIGVKNFYELSFMYTHCTQYGCDVDYLTD